MLSYSAQKVIDRFSHRQYHLPDKLTGPFVPVLSPTFDKFRLQDLPHRESLPELKDLLGAVTAERKTCILMKPASGLLFGPDAFEELRSFFQTEPRPDSVLNGRDIWSQNIIAYLQDRSEPHTIRSLLVLDFVFSMESTPRFGARIEYAETSKMCLPGNDYTQLLLHAAELFMLSRLIEQQPGDPLVEYYRKSPDRCAHMVFVVFGEKNPLSTPPGFVLNESGHDHWGLLPGQYAYERRIDLSYAQRFLTPESSPPPRDPLEGMTFPPECW